MFSLINLRKIKLKNSHGSCVATSQSKAEVFKRILVCHLVQLLLQISNQLKYENKYVFLIDHDKYVHLGQLKMAKYIFNITENVVKKLHTQTQTNPAHTAQPALTPATQLNNLCILNEEEC